MAISDTGKAENQRISPEVWEAQQQEIVRLCQAVQAAEKENQALRARVTEALQLRQIESATDWALVTSLRAEVQTLVARVAEMEAGHAMSTSPVLWTIDGAGWAVLWAESLWGEPDRVWCLNVNNGEIWKDDANTPKWFLFFHEEQAREALESWKASDDFNAEADFKVYRVQMAAVATEQNTQIPAQPSTSPKEPPLPVSAGDSLSEYSTMPWEGKP